jgi:hypothetical protein
MTEPQEPETELISDGENVLLESSASVNDSDSESSSGNSMDHGYDDWEDEDSHGDAGEITDDEEFLAIDEMYIV